MHVYLCFILFKNFLKQCLIKFFLSKNRKLRIDSLSQILSYSNAQSGSDIAVFESGTQGLVTASVLHRMGTKGRLVHLYQGQHPQR